MSQNVTELILRNRLRRHVYLSNLKHALSRELPLTARKTVFSHLNRDEEKSVNVFFECDHKFI